jgi:Ca-activated chloride channel family protein
MVMVVVSLLIAGRAGAAERGLLLRGGDGVPGAAPVLGTTVEVRVTGIIARSRVTQIFKNPTQEWLEGIYLFPLPQGAAVDTLRMVVGDRVLEGIVQEKQEARQTYEAAKQQGTKATLIEQTRGDLFTTSIANIGPGETIEVVIELQQIVRYSQGRFELRFPMVWAPEYTLPPRVRTASGACGFPTPPVVPAGAPPVNPFAFHVDLAPGFPLARVQSSTHRIATAKGKGKDGRERWAVDLAGGMAFADGDFALEWAPAVGRAPRAVYFSEEVDGERFSLLMVMPPNDADATAARLPRETVFVVDTSGSMEGTSLEQARQALLFGLDRLQPGDWFNVVRFSSTASSLFPASVPAGPATLAQAREYVRKLAVDGGTEMLPALQIALHGPARPGLVQQVIFTTDGQVSNVAELLKYIDKNVGDRRLFTVAIGDAPNAFFLRKAAEIGRGTFTAIDSVDRVAAGMGALIAQLESPMLRQIDVRWSDPAAEAWPARLPDLYVGEPLVVTARESAAGPVSLSGLRNGAAWSDELAAPAEVKGAGIDKLWAGKKIESLMDSLVQDADAAEVRREVTELGLRHHLVTQYTSLVAVDVEPTAPAGVQPETRVLPVNAPRGSTPVPVLLPDPGDPGVQDAIVVLGESPLLDERRISTGATVSQTELAKIPTARDPWAVLAATPGVLTDRINVGGNESGSQSTYVLQGASADQNVWELDGVVVTDISALGASPGYIDFDAFEEMQVATGGANVEQPTAGVQIYLTTPRGTNEWVVSADALWSGGTLQGDSQSGDNRLDSLRAGGGEVGGPLRRDHLWLWSAFHGSDAERTAFGGQAVEIRQTSGKLKLNVQPTGSNAALVLASRGDVAGSGLGAGPERAPETTWERDGREEVWKIEDTQVFSSSFYLTASAGRVGDRLRDDPKGGQPGEEARIDAAGVARGSWFGRERERRSRTGSLAGSSFFNQGSASHELRFGAEESRRNDVSRSTAPRRITVAGETLGLSEGLDVMEVWRPGTLEAATGTTGLWAEDTISWQRLTAFVGLRGDEQDLGVVGIGGGARPRTLAPRLGLTWAAGAERETLLRASLARFASRLGERAAFRVDPQAPGVSSFHLSDGGAPVFWYADGLADAVSPDLSPEITDEAVLGVERAVRSYFVVGLQATWRRTSDILEERLLVRDRATGGTRLATAADWERAGTLTGALPDGTSYAAPFFDLRPGLTPAGGRLLTNGDRRQDSLGLSLTWEKRLADGWMTRGHLTWQDWTWQTGPDFQRYDDPTDILGSGDDDGDRVAPAVDGLPHDPARFLGGGWSFAASGLVELPGHFDLAASVNGRQGAPLPYYRRAARDRAGIADVQLTESADSFRSRDLVTVDARLGRDFAWRDLGISLGLEVANLFDEGAVTARQLDLGVTRGGRADELVPPRTLRLGVRLDWR